MKEGSVQQSRQGVVQAEWQPKGLYKCSIDTVQPDKYMQITASRTAGECRWKGRHAGGRPAPDSPDKGSSRTIQVQVHAAIGICLTASSGPSRVSG